MKQFVSIPLIREFSSIHGIHRNLFELFWKYQLGRVRHRRMPENLKVLNL
jgi:hypothetical protein